MSNHGKRWTEEDKVRLLNEARLHAMIPPSELDVGYLNYAFKRVLTMKSWARLIKEVQAEYSNMSRVVDDLNEQMAGASAEVLGRDSFKITSGNAYSLADDKGLNITFDDTEPRCKNCKHWHFLHHKTDEDHEVFVTIGDCRIRSVNDDRFPERESDEHCGEHDRNNAL